MKTVDVLRRRDQVDALPYSVKTKVVEALREKAAPNVKMKIIDTLRRKLMPTPIPEPMKEPRDEMEKMARLGAVAFIGEFLGGLEGYIYANRSHVPSDQDATDLFDSIKKVLTFCKARPDWTLNALNHALARFSPNYTAADELRRLREVVDDFEGRLGVVLSREWPHSNTETARLLKILSRAEEAERKANQMVEKSWSTVLQLRSQLEDIMKELRELREL
jgi:hypothetical protein